MSEQFKASQYVIVVGNLSDGYQVHGPYEFEDAMTQSGFFQDTWVMQLVPPENTEGGSDHA